jgi:hypothetical protein
MSRGFIASVGARDNLFEAQFARNCVAKPVEQNEFDCLATPFFVQPKRPNKLAGKPLRWQLCGQARCFQQLLQP